MSFFKKTPQKTPSKAPRKTNSSSQHPALRYKSVKSIRHDHLNNYVEVKPFENAEPTFAESQKNWDSDGDLDLDGDKDWDDLQLTTHELDTYFEEQSSIGDGNCFYHSIVDYLDGIDSDMFKSNDFILKWKSANMIYRNRRTGKAPGGFADLQMFKMHWLRKAVYLESMKRDATEDGQTVQQQENTETFRNTLKRGVAATETDQNETGGSVGVDLWGVDREINVTTRVINADIATFEEESGMWVVSFANHSINNLDGNICFIKNNGYHYTNLIFKGSHRLQRRLQREKIQQREMVQKFARKYDIDVNLAGFLLSQTKYIWDSAVHLLNTVY